MVPSAHLLLLLALGLPFCSFLGNACALLNDRATKYASTACIFLACLCQGGLYAILHHKQGFGEWVSYPPCTTWFEQKLCRSLDLHHHHMMLSLLVLLLSFLVHIYTISYKKEQYGNQKYYALLGGFTAAMVGLCLADNVWMILVCWEWIGVSAYFLVGFYTTKKKNNVAALYGFLVNKLGSLGLWGGLIMLSMAGGSFSLLGLKGGIKFDGVVPAWWVLCQIGILLGAFTKAAQFPFHTWLLKAMRGPTPVSALIHSATMVAAGVFLLYRLDVFLLQETKVWLYALGAFTAVTGAFSAIFQHDAKKILAYSTLSHLGFMMTAIAIDESTGALFYLMAHAIAKGCLFLFVGWLQKKTAATKDIRLFPSGKYALVRNAPLSSFAYFLSVFSLLGVPLTAGFFPKTLVKNTLLNAHIMNEYMLIPLFLVLYFIATTLYLGRMTYYLFLHAPLKAAGDHTQQDRLLGLQWPLWALGAMNGLLFFFYSKGQVLQSTATTFGEVLNWLPLTGFCLTIGVMLLVKRNACTVSKPFLKGKAVGSKLLSAPLRCTAHAYHHYLPAIFCGLCRGANWTEKTLNELVKIITYTVAAISLLSAATDHKGTEMCIYSVKKCGKWLSSLVQATSKQSVQRYVGWSLLLFILSLCLVYLV